jgi:methylated-DNA-protein-cysteine methyltransferase-like protein
VESNAFIPHSDSRNLPALTKNARLDPIPGAGQLLPYNSAVSSIDILHKHRLIYEVVKEIPRRQVATYGQVALYAGLPGQARLAGYALFYLPASMMKKIPWWRVINAQGRISYSEARHGHDHLQRELLEKEGVVFDARGRISLAQYGWKPELRK